MTELGFPEAQSLVRRKVVYRGVLGLNLTCQTCGYRFLKTPWYNPPCKKDGKARLCPNCSVRLLAVKMG